MFGATLPAMLQETIKRTTQLCVDAEDVSECADPKRHRNEESTDTDEGNDVLQKFGHLRLLFAYVFILFYFCSKSTGFLDDEMA
jgi:hypothetical protein